MFNLILFAVQQLTMDGKHTILKKIQDNVLNQN